MEEVKERDFLIPAPEERKKSCLPVGVFQKVSGAVASLPRETLTRSGEGSARQLGSALAASCKTRRANPDCAAALHFFSSFYSFFLSSSVKRCDGFRLSALPRRTGVRDALGEQGHSVN